MTNINQKLITVTENPINKEKPLSSLMATDTQNSSTYIRNHFDVPDIELENWDLALINPTRLHQHFTMEQLQTYPHRELVVLMECAGNGRTTLIPPVNGTNWNLGAVSQVVYKGISLSNILSVLDVNLEAKEVVFTGGDCGKVRTGESTHYQRSLTMEEAMDKDVLLAWEMNGQALKPENGFPLRLVVPGWYGMASVKWLQKIELLDRPFEGFFQTEEYVFVEDKLEKDGTPVDKIVVKSLILSHEDGDRLQIGKTLIQGLAWSGNGMIRSVEISLDSGDNWQKAQIENQGGAYGWVKWSKEIDFAEKGSFQVAVRASDSEGNTQPMVPRWNRGGYANNVVHQVELTVG